MGEYQQSDWTPPHGMRRVSKWDIHRDKVQAGILIIISLLMMVKW
jgi:hypothetical protein